MRFVHFKLVGPIVGAIALSIVALASISYYGGHRLDDEVRSRQETLVKRNIGLWISDIEFSLTSWTIWDEPIAKIDNDFDYEWTDRNIGASLLGTSRARFAAVLDHDDTTIYSKVSDEVKDRPFFLRGPGAIIKDASGLVADVRKRELLPKKPGIPDPISSSRIEVVDSDAVLLSASLFQPDFGTAKPEGKRAPILVTAMPIGNRLADFFGTRFLLDDARVSSISDVSLARAVVSLTIDRNGDEQVLSWHPPAPAADLLRQSLPLIVMVVIALVAGGIFILRMSQTTVRMLISRERQMRHAATHDFLTGLANRARLEIEFLQLLTKGSLVVACLDLDGFKLINDAHGHASGDELLKATAERLRSGVRDQDRIFRLGGDEFAILMPGITLDQAHEVCRSLSAMLSLPVMLSDGSVSVGASFGLHLVIDVNTSCDAAFRAADAALYRAKSTRHLDHGRVEPEMHGRAALPGAR